MPEDGVNQLVSGSWGRQARPRWKQRCHFPQREKAKKDNHRFFFYKKLSFSHIFWSGVWILNLDTMPP